MKPSPSSKKREEKGRKERARNKEELEGAQRVHISAK